MNILYSDQIPTKESLFKLYSSLNWNEFLKLNEDELLNAMKQSWHSIYAYHDNILVGTGRVVSDGIINAYICGLGVHPDYRNKGIGTKILDELILKCKSNNLHIQFFAEEKVVPYYTNKGFEKFAVGIKV